MTLDIVTKGIPYLHMAIVTVMVFASVPRIFSYTALIWGCCAIMSISLPEEDFYLEFRTPLAIPAPVRFASLFYYLQRV